MSVAPAPRRRILLVEDDRELREALAEALEDLGHQVVGAEDGGEALKRMRAVHPDVVVLDLMMPGMDGWQFRIEQKRDPSIADTPVVAMSASNSSTAAAIDADLFIQKPAEANTVERAIEDVLCARQRRLEPVKAAQTERMAALGTLAAGVAHEINNPLTYVLLHLTSALRQLGGLGGDGGRGKVEPIEALVRSALEGAERIRGITTGIRTFSRIDDLGRSALDVHGPLDAALRLVGNDLRHRARLVVDHGEVPRVSANEGRLGQVFLNLISNAIQALPDGAADTNLITVRTSTDAAGRVVVAITDTGPGIPDHLLSHIFEPFFTTKPMGQGTGLGLSISHGIVRSLGGEIEVDSKVGVGTTFRVILPAGGSHAAIAAAASEIGRRRRILIVADAPADAEALRRALSPDDDVVVARGGRAALALVVDSNDFDAILCDRDMAELSGEDVRSRLVGIRPRLADRTHLIDRPVDLPRLRMLLATAPPARSKEK